MWPDVVSIRAGCPAWSCRAQQHVQMVKKRQMHPKPLFDEQLLLECFDIHGIKPSHAKKCWAHLVRHPGASIAEIPGLPAAAYQVLQDEFAVQVPMNGSTWLPRLIFEISIRNF